MKGQEILADTYSLLCAIDIVIFLRRARAEYPGDRRNGRLRRRELVSGATSGCADGLGVLPSGSSEARIRNAFNGPEADGRRPVRTRKSRAFELARGQFS